jgi:hypothetical protein
MSPLRQPATLRQLVVLGIACAVLGSACGSSQQSGSPGPSTSSSAGVSPAASSSRSPASSATPSSLPTSTPTPRVEIAQWSKPQRIVGGYCGAASATIDDRGTAHVAAICSESIHYATTSGGRWTSASFAHPTNRVDTAPQLAFDGDVLYLAWTRAEFTGDTCTGGNDFEDVGVYVRRRQLPNGKWSDAARLGSPTDGLQNLRVTGGVMHLTVNDRSDGRTYYETVWDGAVNRYSLPGATGSTSLRIGTDGKARIAYEAANNLQMGVFDGSAIAHSAIPGSSNSWGPSLVLDPGNHAHVLWMRSDQRAGCEVPERESKDGTYYGSDASGSWQYRRISTELGGGSLTLDSDSGQVHVAINSRRGIRYLTKVESGPWTQTRIANRAGNSPIIRLNPTTRELLVVFNDIDDGIFAVTGTPFAVTGTGSGTCGC